jgi:hypothetical protein
MPQTSALSCPVPEGARTTKNDKYPLFGAGDGKTRVVADDDFITALEEIEEKNEGRMKLACTGAKEPKELRKKAWEQAVRVGGKRRGRGAGDLPMAPKR